MVQDWRRQLAQVSLLALLLVLIVSAPDLYAQVPDPRVAQIRAGLERAGLRVKRVTFIPPEGRRPPVWLAETDAAYMQPSAAQVTDQAFKIWGVMYGILNRDPPLTVLYGAQMWTKYGIYFGAPIRDISTFITASDAARSAAEKERAFDAFLDTWDIFVVDLETGKEVDVPDFMNKNFVQG